MFDLDQHLDQLNACLDLMRAYSKMNLTGDLARNFIHELSVIDDSYHEQITEAFDEVVEASKISASHLLQSRQHREIAVDDELNKSLVYVVDEFIAKQLAEVGE